MISDNRARPPLRTWPAAVILALFVAAVAAKPLLWPDRDLAGPFIVGAAASFLAVVWWLAFSRARWFDRLLMPIAMIVIVLIARQFVHPSIAGGGMGNLPYILGFQSTSFALMLWSLTIARATDRGRYATLIAALIVIGATPLLMIRTDGVKGAGFLLHWRWTPTAEDRLLATVKDEPTPDAVLVPTLPATAPAPAAPAATPTVVEHAPAASATAAEPPPTALAPVMASAAVAEWPGFRGPGRDGVVHHVQIKTDWSQSPPVEMWRRPVGPGWSSFSVRGDVMYTQEQRGDDEIVACYRVSTGEPIWRHRDSIRFYESNGGAGPRGTPTIDGNRVFAMGATGRLNALDANTGKVVWSHDTIGDTKREVPMWGISSSPLIVDDLVIVSVYGTLAGYEKATGKLRWTGPTHGGSYSSPQLVTEDGVRQVLILSSPGVVSVDPRDGSELWTHKWEGGAIVQPAVTDEGDILINAMAATGGMGTRRLAIKHTADGWQAEERWTTNGLKPYFNDLVIHNGYAYGFDGNILSCIDLADGKRKWKGGRYGNGQLVLLADQDVLLVMSEDGELALVGATPDQFKEIARVPALNAKTWNHPVIVGDVLLVRNGEEMAAFRLSLADRGGSVP